MKCTAYLRVARNHIGRTTMAVSAKPNHAPLKDGDGNPYPTVCFGIKLDIPESRLHEAEQIIASLTLPEAEVIVADVEYAS